MNKKLKILKNKFKKYNIDGYIIPKMMIISLNTQKLTD